MRRATDDPSKHVFLAAACGDHCYECGRPREEHRLSNLGEKTFKVVETGPNRAKRSRDEIVILERIWEENIRSGAGGGRAHPTPWKWRKLLLPSATTMLVGRRSPWGR